LKKSLAEIDLVYEINAEIAGQRGMARPIAIAPPNN
jgi:hypothetical protein